VESVYDGSKDEWAELKNPSEIVVDANISDKFSPRENLSAAPENIFIPIIGQNFPLEDMEEISSVSQKEEGISKEDKEHLR
jgi:hypothetical protein